MTLTVIAEFREQVLQLVWWRLPPSLLGGSRNLLKDNTLVSEQERAAGMHYDKKAIYKSID